MESSIRVLAAVVAVLLLANGCWRDTGDDPDGPVGDVRLDGTDGDVSAGDAADADTAGGGDGLVGDVDATDADAADVDAEPMCRGDDECPGNAVCVENSCRYYRFVQIRDVTRTNSSSASKACNDDAAGADLFELELQGPFGKPIGYARALRAKSTATNNTDASGVFDGTSNSLEMTNTGLCPSGGFGPDSVLSLGCEGSLVVAFADGSGRLLALSGGQRLVVHEYGRQCCSDSCPEEYWEVRVCTAQVPRQFKGKMPDGDGHWPSCKTQALGVGAGRDEVVLRLPRP